MNKEPLIICIVLLVFVIGVIFTLLFMNMETPKGKHNFKQYLTVENNSHNHKNVSIELGDIVIPEGKSRNIIVHSDSAISSDGFSLQLPNSNAVKTIYVTENGIFTNLNCVKGKLINESKNPVIFAEIGNNGKRWNLGLAYENESINATISKGSKWEVISPDKKDILAHFKSEGKPKIIFNGEKLYEV